MRLHNGLLVWRPNISQDCAGGGNGLQWTKSERVACAAAARLLAFVSIAARLKEQQAEAAAKHQITVESMIEDFAQDAKDAKADKQHGAAVSARTAIAKLAGLWVDRAENINGNYAISDKPLSEQEWEDQYVRKH